jgi:hypothetical protein
VDLDSAHVQVNDRSDLVKRPQERASRDAYLLGRCHRRFARAFMTSKPSLIPATVNETKRVGLLPMFA